MMLLASPSQLSKPPPGLTDVNKVWHYAKCQRRFAATLFTSPEYAARRQAGHFAACNSVQWSTASVASLASSVIWNL